MVKTRGGGQAGRNQGLEVQDVTDSQVASATPLKVKKATVKKVASPKKIKVQTQRRRSSRNKKEVEYVTTVHGEIEDVTPVDDEIEDLPPEAGGVVVEAKADEAEKATSKDDKEDNEIEEEACLNGEEQKEDEEEAANMEEEEVVGDGVSNTQDAEIPSTEGVQLPGDEVKEKKRRGPTKMRRVAEHPNDKVVVTFTDIGEHVGPGSVTLSSFLGPLVREHVPVTLSDWRKLDAATKATMWEEIQGRFNLQEEWQKAVIFKQLGNLWRAGKSRLVSQVRAAKSSADR